MESVGTFTLIVISCVLTYLLSHGILKLRLKQISNLFELTLKKIRDDSVLMPSLVFWADGIQEYYDQAIADRLIYKKRPAKKASDEVKEARAVARENKKEFLFLRNRLIFYESLAPWLSDYVDVTVDEFITSIQKSQEVNTIDIDDEIDPIERYVPKTEWKKLSTTKRNQLALDRYLDPNRKKDLWKIGIDYERFVGYQFEQQGYKVIYHGAINEKEDLGIDLICENETEILSIQCKRLSVIKEIPVRENIIAQIYGASRFLEMKTACKKKLKPVLVTTYRLSDEARNFAKHLEVEIHENYELKPYPLIKCNISSSNEKIYHLPMDQQYDRVTIDTKKGGFYAKTVLEAEKAGFRRAYRWQGNLN
jgi:hypothetical protein